jgi:hypothetical protein
MTQSYCTHLSAPKTNLKLGFHNRPKTGLANGLEFDGYGFARVATVQPSEPMRVIEPPSPLPRNQRRLIANHQYGKAPVPRFSCHETKPTELAELTHTNDLESTCKGIGDDSGVGRASLAAALHWRCCHSIATASLFNHEQCYCNVQLCAENQDRKVSGKHGKRIRTREEWAEAAGSDLAAARSTTTRVSLAAIVHSSIATTRRKPAKNKT